MGWDLVVIGWFCELCYGVVSEGDSNVSVFEKVGDSVYVWGGKGEGCPLWAVFVLLGGVAHVILCCIWCFNL